MTDGLDAATRIPLASVAPDFPSQMPEKSGAEDAFLVV